MAYCLLIDTSLHGAALGLIDLKSEGFLWDFHHSETLGSAEALPNMVNRALKESKLRLDAIEAIVVSKGPGSFTGIRVGLAFAYGVIAGNPKTKLMAVSSLGLLASTLGRELGAEQFGLFVPAARTLGYLMNGHLDRIELESVDLGGFSDKTAAQQYFTDRLKAAGGVSVIPPWGEVEDLLTAMGKGFDLLPVEKAGRKALSAMAEAARNKWPDGFDRELPEPLFLRKSTAEERLNLNSNGGPKIATIKT